MASLSHRLLATNNLTAVNANGYSSDSAGAGVLSDAEKALRAQANTIYCAPNGG